MFALVAANSLWNSQLQNFKGFWNESTLRETGFSTVKNGLGIFGNAATVTDIFLLWSFIAAALTQRRGSTMNADGYTLPPTSRLRCISITEIICGVFAVIGSIYNLIKRAPAYHTEWPIFHVACAVLLLSTGIHGFRAIRRLRMNILDRRSFRILGACNVVLCIIYSLCMVTLLFVAIFLATMPNIAQSLMGIFASTNAGQNNTHDDDDDDDEHLQEWRRKYAEIAAELASRNNMLLAGLIVAMVLAGIFTGLTATAATISFRLSASILAASRQPVMLPPAGVPLTAGPGYGTYPMVPMDPPPSYTPYQPVKKGLD